MKKNYSRHPAIRTVAGIAAAAMISLSVAQPVVAFDSMDGLGINGNARIYGLSFSGDFDFNKMSVNSFAHTPTDVINSNFDDGGLVSFSTGMVKTDIPLLTFGDDVRYPGLLYNHDGQQFFSHVAAATEGDKKSESLIWVYVLAGAALAGIVFTMSESTDDSSKTPDPVPDEPVVEDDTDTTISTETDPVVEETVVPNAIQPVV